MKFKVVKKYRKLEIGDVVEGTPGGSGTWNVRGAIGSFFGVPNDCLEPISDEASASSSPVSSPPVVRHEPPPPEVVRQQPPPLVVRQEPPPLVVVARDESLPVIVAARDESPPMVASSSGKSPDDELPIAEVKPLAPSLRSSLGAALGSSHVTPLDVQGVTLRLFCIPRMAPTDLIKIVKASEPFMLSTGDQSLGEAVSSGKSFYYECNTHKQLLLNDLLDLHRGLRELPPARDPLDLAEQDCRYLLAMKHGRGGDGPALEKCAERFVDTCFPSGVDAETYIFVTCKDAGGQGDITNARKQRQTLMTTFGARHVFLVMADTARRQAIEAGEREQDVWLVSEGPSDDPMHIRNWREPQAKVQLIHAAAPLNASLVNVIKAGVLAGGGAYKETVLLEYGYSQYSAAPAHVRHRDYRDAMGMGPSELGFLVHRELRAYRCNGSPSGAPDLATLSLEPLTKLLLDDVDDPRDYGRKHRLYTGYSHFNGERFVKLVAHRERALRSTEAGAVPFIDIVCVGNTFRIKTWKSKYDTLVGELGGGGGPDLEELGIQRVEIYDFAKASDDPRDASPYVITATRHEIPRAKPKPELPRSRWNLDDFLMHTTPGVLRGGFANEPGPVKRSTYEEAGVWLTSPVCAHSFMDLSDVLCAARDFDRVFGGNLNRSMRSSVPPAISLARVKILNATTVDALRVEKEKIEKKARE
jgi:hypothetical protein